MQFYILHVKVLHADLWTNEEDILYTQVFPPLTILKCYEQVQRKRASAHPYMAEEEKYTLLIYFAWHQKD